MTTTEKNNLISKFMGEETLDNLLFSVIVKNGSTKRTLYESSWEQLIPVLKKIDELLYSSYVDTDITVQDFFIKWSETNHEAIEYTNNHLMTCITIEEVYNDVIDFINFYNKYCNGNNL